MSLSRFTRAVIAMLAIFTVSEFAFDYSGGIAFAQKQNARKGKKPSTPKLPPLKTPEDKLKFLGIIKESMPTRRIARSVSFDSEDLDKKLEYRIGASERAYEPIVNDEIFLRRVSLDLTGDLPSVAKIKQFTADKDPKKREKVVDELLETKAYAQRWGRYWSDVIFYESEANKNRIDPDALAEWFAGEFEKNTSWDTIVAQLIAATPVRNKDKRNDWGQDNGVNNFVLACENKPEILAAQTARIFMGISIQCAECHDHPFDNWKREQFHELAAFFSRGKYYMTDNEDPTEKTEMKAKFLLGETPPTYIKTADQRRVAIAAFLVYNPDNYWFARAFVNRIWNETVGDGFYAVDSLGPDQEVLHADVVNRIAAVFRYKDFDPKWVFRLIMNSEAYQRDIRTISSESELFTGVRPYRLRPEQVVSSVMRLTGEHNYLTKQLNQTFDVNPSVPQDDLEGSIQQALLMMNNGALHGKLNSGPLKKRLMSIKSNQELVKQAYLEILARHPDEWELKRHVEYIEDVGKRYEAVEDILWVLVNSTEFLTKR